MDITSSGEVKIDQALTNLIIGYGDNQFIAPDVIPTVTVAKDNDLFYKWDNNGIHTTGLNTKRSDRGKAKEIGISVGTDNYAVEQHALRDFLMDTIMKNADSILKLREATAKNLIDTLDLRRELDCKNLVFTAANYASGHSTTLSGNDRWSINHADSDPVADILAAKETVMKNARVVPNTLVIGFQGLNKLKVHPKAVEAVKYVQATGQNKMTIQALADWLGVERIIVGSGVYNTAKEGQTVTPDFIWKDHAALVYVPKSTGINIPAFAYEFRPSHTPRTVERYTEPGLKGEFVEVNEKRIYKVTFNKAGFFFENAFTTS